MQDSRALAAGSTPLSTRAPPRYHTGQSPELHHPAKGTKNPTPQAEHHYATRPARHLVNNDRRAESEPIA